MTAAAPRLDFSLAEYRTRVQRVRAEMDARRVDALVVDATEHVAYLTGYGPRGTLYQACVLPLVGDPVMVVRAADEETCADSSWVRIRITYPDHADTARVVAEVVRGLTPACRRLGLELDSNFLTVRQYEALRAALRGTEVVDFGGVIRRLRWIKSSAEITLHRLAAAAADRAIERVLGTIAGGRTDREVAAAVYAAVLEAGADPSYSLIVTSGARVHAMHGTLSERRLERGDILHTELMPQMHGYAARLMRSTVVGAPAPSQVNDARTLIAIQDEQLHAMRVGALAGDVDRIVREQVVSRGLRERYENVTGYTLGYLPMLATPRTSDFSLAFLPGAAWRLEAGMVFHMYVWARGLAFSESVVLTEHGAERLTSTPRELLSIPA